MKRIIAMLAAMLLAASFTGCAGTQKAVDDEICPGKQPGVADHPPTLAEGFDQTVDMGFTTADTKGNSVTNEVFSGSKRGTWLVFWKADNDKSAAELGRLNAMLPIAEENGYKVAGIVMDGEKHAKAAEEMTANLNFTNLVWNDEVAARYDGVEQFFSKEYHEENKESFAQWSVVPSPGDPVFVMANSRGQMQSTCILVPVSDKKWNQC